MNNIRSLLLLCVIVFSCKVKVAKDVPSYINSTNSTDTIKAVLNYKLYAGKLLRVENFNSVFVTARNVDVWLPKEYDKTKKYSVLYMHDGQMLFDASKTWNNQEWKVDEWATKMQELNKTKDFIVVGIWNIPQSRHSDYFPEKPFMLLSKKTQDSLFTKAKENQSGLQNGKLKADAYLAFIVNELKPYIDANFSTHSDRKNTFTAGASMGGLIAMYAVCEYPEIFAGAACMSTHWIGLKPNRWNPVPEVFFSYLKDNAPDPNTHKFYFDYGTETLDAHYVTYAGKIDSIFQSKGYTNANFRNIKFQGADHSENSWNKRLATPLLFLLGKNQNAK
ncbi:alpha/beta hydrolase [Tenacibaculum sp. SG-28]|uniref:alpha/beta hydrolase n=1 Tax=Tenacibaculum sp. SG-28 TaxID=754426 RepID=UPI000CF5555A|nr:alpha/beta fold hydrolase [Tenacibaculum sp. SG-28]PQJ23299.1 esterase [Tenacibaculum sp. SG-28]